MEKKLREIFADNGYFVYEGEEETQLQLDSLQFISIICDIENEFDLSVPEEVLSGEGLNNFYDFVVMVQKIMGGNHQNEGV